MFVHADDGMHKWHVDDSKAILAYQIGRYVLKVCLDDRDTPFRQNCVLAGLYEVGIIIATAHSHNDRPSCSAEAVDLRLPSSLPDLIVYSQALGHSCSLLPLLPININSNETNAAATNHISHRLSAASKASTSPEKDQSQCHHNPHLAIANIDTTTTPHQQPHDEALLKEYEAPGIVGQMKATPASDQPDEC